tara:strand:+ start:8861 stop:9169 length:309 start_codon:yes stop_codon:yes gene_type:complete
MVTIVIQGGGYQHYWNPLLLKYVDRTDVIRIVRDQLPRSGAVFITPDYCIPTYETMIALEKGLNVETVWLNTNEHTPAKSVDTKVPVYITTMYDARKFSGKL